MASITLHSLFGKTLQSVPADEIVEYFDPRALANMIWSFAVFDDLPCPLLEFLYRGLLRNAAVSQRESFQDDRTAHATITSVLYALILTNLQGNCNELLLPDSFLDEWKGVASSKSTDDRFIDSSELLSSTTSKLQLDVSKTFERLGFDHVVEHTITLRDLANNHGIRVPLKPIIIFSINIANVEEMIAFEVDGQLILSRASISRV